MHWDRRLGDLTAARDQAVGAGDDGPALSQRDAEVAAQRVAEYAQVDLAGRLAASVGHRVDARLVGGWQSGGVVVRVGHGWFLLEAGTVETVVLVAAVTELHGVADAAVPDRARPVTARLGVGSVLRSAAGAVEPARLDRVDGSSLTGRLGRVGADFVEVRVGEAAAARVHVVPFAALAAVQRR